MVYIITSHKSSPQFPQHATRFANEKDAKKALKDLAGCNFGDWLDCKIVDPKTYESICISHPCVADNSRCHDTRQKI